VRTAGDGVYSIGQDGYIKLVDLKTNSTKNLLAVADVKDVCQQRYNTGPR
jgi:dipeptidyl aminopeptidase